MFHRPCVTAIHSGIARARAYTVCTVFRQKIRETAKPNAILQNPCVCGTTTLYFVPMRKRIIQLQQATLTKLSRYTIRCRKLALSCHLSRSASNMHVQSLVSYYRRISKPIIGQYAWTSLKS